MDDASVFRLIQPGQIADPLTDVLRDGAAKLLACAIEAEVEAHLAAYRDLKLPNGHQRIVRHGRMPEREVQTGVGAVKVKAPRVRDRGTEEKIRFQSSILPKYVRRTKSLEALIPWLYLKGVSSNTMQDALSALLGPDAPNLSPDTISRLTKSWADELEAWEQRDLSARHYVYLWADGIYFQARTDPDNLCMLVIIGATPEGKKELVGFTDGYRESTQSWRELLLDLKARGLALAPSLATGDGGMGFWAALREVFPVTSQQRCWVHKTANVLNKLPKSIQAKAKTDLHNIWMAETRKQADKAFDHFTDKYGAKYENAVACLTKDREPLLRFYDFPAEHWRHIRTTNPIESTFATVRHRTRQTKGCLSRDKTRIMVFKLIKAAEKNWLRLRGRNQLPKLIAGVKFVDGDEIAQVNSDANKNAA
jgi:transposase-like protein